jgi:hypothetical protein
MAKVAAVILAGTDAASDLGRVVNGLEVAKEAQEKEGDARVVFDGAGTQWVGKLSDAAHDYRDLFSSVRPSVQGACAYCSEAYGVKESVEANDVELLGAFDGHPSIAGLIDEGYQVLTF